MRGILEGHHQNDAGIAKPTHPILKALRFELV